MFSWLGFGRSRSTDDENRQADERDTDPLLSDDATETALQQNVYSKLHSYLMLRALSKGYLPSTEQTVAHLRSLLSADFLNPQNTALSPAGRKLVRDCRKWLTQVINMLLHKNGEDQVQEFLHCTRRARMGFDGSGLVESLEGLKTFPGDANAGYEALRTVSEMLMTNADFRKLMSDFTTISRQVLSDTANTTSAVAETVAETVKPADGELEAVNSTTPAGAEDSMDDDDGVKIPAQEVGEVLAEGAMETVNAAAESAEKELRTEGRGGALLERMKMVVLRLRGNADYTHSVSILAILLKRYAYLYSRSLSKPMETVADEFQPNPELDEAVRKFWSLITSFGRREEWYLLEERWEHLVNHITRDDEFEALIEEIGNTLQNMFTDPEFPSSAERKLDNIRTLIQNLGEKSTAKEDLDLLLEQAQVVFQAVLADRDIANIAMTSRSIALVLYPTPYTLNPAVVGDLTHVLLPLALSLIQYIPLLRATISTPELDLLVENLILEPGDTVNTSSFFPHMLRVETQNDFELRKAKFRYASEITSLATLHLKGLTVRADEVGYWMKVHTGIWRFWDEGIVSVMLDEKGVDVSLDVEFAREKIENLVALRNVSVKINKLDYAIKRSRYRWLAWPFKPILKPILRRVLRKQFEAAIADGCHFINRELVFARERLRATRIAKPRDLWTFLRAVGARLTPEPDPDAVTSIGWTAGGEESVFENRYAPGSIVKIWEERREEAGDVVDSQAEVIREVPGGVEHGWRNGCFDLRG